ncbi:MAG TPA: hypothetical protein VKT77_04195 [Chthonomonadaceae bacterium]|nr:hypothetical protein [Chthonomonadaceae bacterium]
MDRPTDIPPEPANAPPILAARLLETALVLTFLAHGLGMLSLAALLLPGLPGGSSADVGVRAAYIAGHPWLWRLGWLPWQMTAASDILLAVALVRTPWIPRAPAYLTLLLTCIAILPDQIGQAIWITHGVRTAQRAVVTGDPLLYSRFEAQISVAVSAWAALLYTLGALGWTWCFVSAGTWNRRLPSLSVALWSIFLFASISPLLPAALRPAPALVGAANGIGFLLMEWWFLEVLELVLRRSRTDAAYGRFMAWRAPRPGPAGALLTTIANSRVVREACSLLPRVPFDSDITDVVYVNYLVEAQRADPLVPQGLTLRRLGPDGRYALFTHLTYRHGRLGPRLLRGLPLPLPSGVQSNWRIQVADPRTGAFGVSFITNAADHPVITLGGRLILEAMPMHWLARGGVTRSVDGCFRLVLDPGAGNGPDAEARLCPTSDRALPAPWSECFADYDAFLEYCVPQNRAMGSQPWLGRISRQEIRLDIPLSDCSPLAGTVASRAASEIAGSAEPLCFHVANVAFKFDRQEFDRH